MPDGLLASKISAVLHLPEKLPYSRKNFLRVVGRILQQYDHVLELVIIDHDGDNSIQDEISQMNTEGNPVKFLHGEFKTSGAYLNAAMAAASGDYLLYIDNRQAEIYLKNSAAAAYLVACERNPEAGMFYSDYESGSENDTNEVHLLKHHAGRVRDNQDYGKVLLIKKSVLELCGGFDESLEYNSLYDIRLKISEHSQIIHLANRYSGSLYRIVSEGKGHNVFDYLLASKESQIEAENVLTSHLKRIQAYLETGSFYTERNQAKDCTLKASVIIPVNNRADFIGVAIESVLDQSVPDIEVIVVVNGGLGDPTANAVKAYMAGGEKYIAGKPEVRLIILDINNIGLCLNLGVKSARGEFYVQLDSDDRLKPDAVEKILQVFESDRNIGMVIGSYEVWELDSDTGEITRVEDIPVVTHDEWTEENGRNNLLRINGAGAPRSIPIALIKEIGYFGINDEPFARNYGEDYEMVLKISERHRIGRIWDPIYDVVRHSGGTDHSIDKQTIDRNDEAKDYMRLEAIKRRMLANGKTKG